jgi:hypothetical protein
LTLLVIFCLKGANHGAEISNVKKPRTSKKSNHSAVKFMRQFFRERIAQFKREQASSVHFRRKFYTDECDFGSRLGTLEMFQSEKVSSISSSGTNIEVITERENANTPGMIVEFRYVLQPRDENWKICEVDLRCCSCDGKPGNDKCPACHATGWRNTKNYNGNLNGPNCC